MPLTLRVTKGFEKNEKVSLAGKDMSVFNHSSTAKAMMAKLVQMPVCIKGKKEKIKATLIKGTQC